MSDILSSVPLAPRLPAIVKEAFVLFGDDGHPVVEDYGLLAHFDKEEIRSFAPAGRIAKVMLAYDALPDLRKPKAPTHFQKIHARKRK